MASKARARSRGKIGKGSRRRTAKKASSNKGSYIASKNTKKRPDYSTLTGRDAGIVKSQKKTRADKIKESEQSVGSLDRRINKALAEGDTAKAKDLRSRLNKFTKDLGYNRAIEAGGVLKSKDGKIIRDSSGNPILRGTGKQVYDLTKDVDFIDPTRRLQNVYPDQYGKMYPFQAQLQAGLPGVRIAKEFFGMSDKDIPYRYPGTNDVFGKGAFPAQRYGLDYTVPSNRQPPLDEDPFPELRPRQPGLDIYPDIVPPGKDEVTDKDRQAAIERGIDPNYIFPVIDDPSTEIIETDSNVGSAIQLAEAANTKGELADIVEEVTNQKNLNKYPYQNVFALPKEVKEKFNKEATENVKTYEMETYGREISEADLAKAGINEAYYNMNFDSPIIQNQLFQSGVVDEKNVPAPIIKADFPATSLNTFLKPNTYSGQEWLDKQAADKAAAINNIQADNTLNDTQKIQLTEFINNPPDMTTGLLDQNNLSLSDMVVNENFDTGVDTDQASLDVLNSLAEPKTQPNYLKRLFGFNQ
tara:strand:- start:2604 stop:4187 length:1584 start_codon:yes stop_codon:yes gene_type:complete